MSTVIQETPRPTSKATADPPQHANRVWWIAALYVTCALGGALLGREYYQANPPAIGDRLVFSDLRHFGALFGALIAAMCAILAHRIRVFHLKSLAQLVVLVAVTISAYVLCEFSVGLGLMTIATLLVPWVIAFFSLRRSRRLAGTGAEITRRPSA